MCIQLRQGTGSGATLLVGLRAGRILKYNIEIHPASLGVSRDSRELLNFVSQGAVTHLEMVNETEGVAAYTNGDVRITKLDPSLIFSSWFYLTLVASASRRYGNSTDTETLSYLLWYVFRRLVICTASLTIRGSLFTQNIGYWLVLVKMPVCVYGHWTTHLRFTTKLVQPANQGLGKIHHFASPFSQNLHRPWPGVTPKRWI